MRPHIDAGNGALIASAEISLDVRKDGFLFAKKEFRRASTHRFTVLHDIGNCPSRESQQIKHCGVDEFKTHLIETLQLARAAVIYFVEMVATAESCAATPEKQVSITVPSHHSIRAETTHKVSASADRSRRKQSGGQISRPDQN
ncbi:MAG: LA2681 family HEPN domain-containing protein [Candidatus Acidiferrales bacterium]